MMSQQRLSEELSTAATRSTERQNREKHTEPPTAERAGLATDANK